ncbi:MAG: transcription repressor NadR [Lachnospiraceae bacterium]|nr:transcription repressor NadR [Lachnospiraceae bacterium]
MTGEERRTRILSLLKKQSEPVSGSALAKELQVTRQVIVQDIALIRARGYDIQSTYKGYLLEQTPHCTRVFKVIHEDADVERELQLYVDMSGVVQDVFVYHKRYGVVKAELNIRSRRDIALYLEDMRTGKSMPLKNLTSGYHYHTIVAQSEEILDAIQEKLQEEGFLAQLKDYEPVDFWSK